MTLSRDAPRAGRRSRGSQKGSGPAAAPAGPPADSLRRAAGRAGEDPFFLASALQSYGAAYGLDEAGLAGAVGCHPEDLPRLALCRLPSGETFRKDVERLAAQFSLRPEALANLVRESDAVRALQAAMQINPAAAGAPAAGRMAAAGTTAAYAGLLLAARDRESDEPELPERGEPEQRSEQGPSQGSEH